MFEIRIVDYDDLPGDLKETEYCCRYSQYSNFFLLYNDDKLIFHQSDKMEPEDVSFHRDLSWIRDLVLQVNKLGKAQGHLDELENKVRKLDGLGVV